ncbi:hypothetical protein ALC53_11188 [Atta colombica]|uniref:Uncharacterized protein n=1 Tax=Atta colombica TaxID=520822 RepID=A0A195B234_9HYME|nr:hypothetical protein ALC53_11188 [Atta colombica]
MWYEDRQNVLRSQLDLTKSFILDLHNAIWLQSDVKARRLCLNSGIFINGPLLSVSIDSATVVLCKQFDETGKLHFVRKRGSGLTNEYSSKRSRSVMLTSQIFGVSPAKTKFALPNRLIFTRPRATVNIRGLPTENNANSVNIGKL